MSSNKRFCKASTLLDQADLRNQCFSRQQERPLDHILLSTEMTALSLQTPSTSQNQQKPADQLAKLAPVVVSAGWSTDFNAENSFNNQEFDSAVFFRSSYFKRQHKDYLH